MGNRIPTAEAWNQASGLPDMRRGIMPDRGVPNPCAGVSPIINMAGTERPLRSDDVLSHLEFSAPHQYRTDARPFVVHASKDGGREVAELKWGPVKS